MSNGNVGLIQSVYAAFGRGEIATIVKAMAPDVDWRVVGRNKDYPLFGGWKGPGGVQEFFKLVGETQEATEFSPREFSAADDKVFVLGHYAWKLRKTGKSVASDWIHVFKIKNGKVTSFREFTDTATFAEAFRA
jgi:ketosteroid isomerase-like protein